MSDEIEDSEDEKRIKEAVATLGEFYDSVQIFCTRHEPIDKEGTESWHYGIGNFFTRYGHVKCWLDGQTEKTKIETREGLK